MSVSAFDQLLLSAAGKPSLSSASKKRDLLFSTSANASSRLDQALAINQRVLAQTKQRKSMHKPRAISPHSHGKTSALSRTVLSAFKGDQLAQLEASAANTVDESVTGVFSIDSKVKLFFDGLSPETEAGTESQSKARDPAKRRGVLSWPRLPSPVKLLRRRPAKPDALAVQVPVVNVRVSHQELLNRQIERVRWRRRSSSSQTRQRSLSGGGSRSHRRSKVSNNDQSAQQHAREDTGVIADSAVAAESNARLSLELMERKYKTMPQWHDPEYYSGLITTRSESTEDALNQNASPLEAGEVDGSSVSELEALRAENAEQKALIRQLLIENRRLLAHTPTVATASAVPRLKTQTRERPEDSDNGKFDRRDRGISVASTWSTATTASALWSGEMDRRPSLTFAVIDGQETMIDHKFEDLVSEITAELAELLAEDSSSSITSSTSRDSSSSRRSSIHYDA